MTEISPLSGNPLRAIFEVTASLVSSTRAEEVFADVVAKIGEAMNVWSCDLMTYVPERDITVYEAFWCAGGVTEDDREYVGTVNVLRERPDIRAILQSHDLTEQHVDDPRLSAHDKEQLTKWGYRSTLDVPLWIGDEVIGILGVQESRFVRRFTPAERDQFARLCELAALGIHNVRTYRRQQERSRHLRSLIEIGRGLATTSQVQDVFDVIATETAIAFDAPRVTVYDHDAAAATLTPRAIHQRDPDAAFDTTGVAETLEECLGDPTILTAPDPILEHATDPDLPAESRAIFEELGEKTCLQAPMIFRGEPMGLVMISWIDQERLVTPDEIELVRGIAALAAVALKNAKLREAAGAGPDGAGEAVGAAELDGEAEL